MKQQTTELQQLADAYRNKVQARMRDLPVYNAALQVETLGFSLYEGRLCGVLITPWCMNLLLLPGADDNWTALAPGKTMDLSFPAGEYSFTLSLTQDIMPHLSLPLFTTVLDFKDQDMARDVAREVLRCLYRETEHKASVDPLATELDKRHKKALSRRDFLRGRLSEQGGYDA
ncbi:MAG: [NiFe]-hydrogenase assembly chaperone HybE [gamma proteobacterium symbiont of Bathyaustriella thionipta]|nr:[NiFe]-hydrogenase assembly chaperone HybE [gamma proteobacterium symbiont of Bathyaustriella thionipta]